MNAPEILPRPASAEHANRERAPEEEVQRRRHHEDLLDEALKETFPASDPIAVYLPRVRVQPTSAVELS